MTITKIDKEYFLRARLKARPNDITNRVDLAILLMQRGSFNDLQEAESHLQKSIKQDSKSGILWYNLGLCRHLMDDYEGSDQAYAEAVKLEPENPVFWTNRGRNKFESGDYENAELFYTRAMILDQDFLLNLYNMSDIQFFKGNWEIAWQLYEARPPVGEKANNPRYKGIPRWWGEDLAGKRLLLHSEQGLGDTIQFFRYWKVFDDMGADADVEVQPSLVPLLSKSYEGVISNDKPLMASYDYQCPLLSAAGMITDLSSIPDDVPYIDADLKLCYDWGAKIYSTDLKVGINWKGRGATNPHGYPGVEIKTGLMAKRNIPVDYFRRLKQNGLRLFSLQQGSELYPEFDHFENIDKEPFVDTAAIMKNLDLVITNDTSIAHLAGALGVPTWVLLPYVPNWRWLLERKDSPWYPTMRLYRQPKMADWVSVFEEVSRDLLQLVKEKQDAGA